MTEQTSTAERLNDLRKRYLAGQQWSRDELKDAIQAMIGDRLHSVQEAGQPKAKKTKAAPVSLDDLLIPSTPAPIEKGTMSSGPVNLVNVPKQIEAPPTKKPPVSFF